MTTPLNLLEGSSDLLWKKEDQARQERFKKQQSQDTISPDAGSLDYSNIYQRLENIKADSATYTAGSIASDTTRRQRDQAIQARKIEEQRLAALQAAYNSMGTYAAGFAGQYGAGQYGAGDGGMPGWGSGGAQGMANILRAAGFPESEIPIMMAIGKAESGWNPNATHTNPSGSIDQGIFQINTIHKGQPYYPQNPFDPLQSAKAAYAIWNNSGRTYKDWVVYQTGAYKQYMQAAPPIQPYAANTGGNTGLRMVNGGVGYSGVPTSTARARALEISRQVLSIPYVWGGTDLSRGVDCSGLVQSVYARIGISMPRQARAQATTGTRVSSASQLAPGDLVAFQWAGGYAGPNTVSHIAIYMGNNQIIEAYGGNAGRIRSLGNSAQDRGAIYVHTRFPGE